LAISTLITNLLASLIYCLEEREGQRVFIKIYKNTS